MADERERIKLLEMIKKLQQEIADLEQQQVTSSQDAAKNEDKLKDLKKDVVARARELRKVNEEIRDMTIQYLEHQKSLQDRISSISSQQFFIKDIEKERIKHYNTIDTKVTSNLEKFNEMADVNIKLASLSDYQTAEAEILREQYRAIADSLDRRGKGIAGQMEFLDKQNEAAYQYYQLSDETKDILDGQHKVLQGISNTIQGAIETAVTLYGNLQGAFGGIVMLAGILEHHITDVNKELGFTLRDMNGAAKSAGVLSFFFDDVAGTVRTITNEMGSIEEATFKTQVQVGLMASTMGISNTEAATLVGQFARMNGNSTDIAADMIATTKEYAKQNNVIPADVLSDLAGSAEEFALFAKEGGDNLIEAATQARMLGVNLGTSANIANSLLDFESSITKELELSALLGRNINLNQARALAYTGDLAGATSEVLKQMGGIDEFNRMDVFQKQAAADAIGVSVAELQKMAANQNRVATQGDVIREKFSEWGAVLDAGLNKYLGTGLKTLGGMITATAQVGGGLSQMGLPIPNIVRGTGQILKNLLQMTAGPIIKGLKGIGGALSDSSVGKGAKGLLGKLTKGVGKSVTADTVGKVGEAGKVPEASGKGLKSVTGAIEKIDPKKLLAGAAAMAIAAGAVFIFAKATQEFMEVSWEAVGMAIVSLAALVGAMIALGALMASGVGAVAILAGAAAMLIMAGAVWVLGKAIQELAIGFEMMGQIGSLIGELTAMVPQIAMLSGAFVTLAGSLAAVAVAGLAALPALMGLTMASEGLSIVANVLGIGNATSGETTAVEDGSISEYQTKMLEKMDILINEVRKGKDVYLDKEKVTNIVVKTSERKTENIWGLGVA